MVHFENLSCSKTLAILIDFECYERGQNTVVVVWHFSEKFNFQHTAIACLSMKIMSFLHLVVVQGKIQDFMSTSV